MAWTDTTRKVEGRSSVVASLNVTLNSTAAASGLFVGSSVYDDVGAPTGITVSDGANGTYTQSYFNATVVAGLDRLVAALHYLANNAGGNLTITSNPTGGGSDSNDIYVAAHEFSGGATVSPASGTPVVAEGTGATASTGAMTPADNDVLLLANVANDPPGTITENAGAEGFTLSNDDDVNFPCASLVFKIIAGAPGTPSHSWTLPSGNWTCGIAAFKSAGGAQPGLGVPLGVGRFNLQQMADAEDEGRFNELDVRNWWREAFA